MKTFWRAACGIVVASTIALLWHERAREDRKLLRSGAPENGLRAPARASTIVAQQAAAPCDLAALEELRIDFARMRALGATAKGEADDLLCKLRARLTSANIVEVVDALPLEELVTPFGITALEAWLEADAGAASVWIASHPARADAHAWLLARALTGKPEVLSRFCERLGSDAWAQAFLDYASREVLRVNPAAAVSLAQSLAPGERQTRLLETIACDWAEREPAAAAEWIRTTSDPFLRERLVAVGAQSYASANPLGAMEWLLLQTPADIIPLEAVRTIFAVWSEVAPTQATAWFDLLPRGELTAQLSSQRDVFLANRAFNEGGAP